MAKAKAKEEEAVEDKKDENADKDAKDGDKEGADKEGDGKEGGEGATGDAAAGAEEPKKSKKKIIIIGAAALAVLIFGGVGAYFMLGKKPVETKAEVEVDANGKPIEKPVFYTLPEFLINLNVGGKATSFLKTTVILELTQQTDVPAVEANMPRLQDSFNTYLRELRASDLAGSAGIQRLREELLLRANKALAPVKINEVLFKEIVVQ
jgi:flagellar FliL protein